MPSRPFLLITNDDGILAPGLKHLWQAVHDIADVVIVAPHYERSGSGLSITWTKPLHIKPVSWDLHSEIPSKPTPVWSLNGTPTDCVKMALSVLLDRKPDLIISGVNRGSNAGRTVLYSGTVGAIIEGALKNIPGIAFSFSDFEVPPVSTTKKTIVSLIHHLLKHPLPFGTFLNVNFPCNCKNGAKGFRIAKQGKGYWIEAPEKRIHPEGDPYYWLGGKWHSFEEDPESDVALLEQGYIAGVPIHVSQLTDETAYLEHKILLENASLSSMI